MSTKQTTQKSEYWVVRREDSIGCRPFDTKKEARNSIKNERETYRVVKVRRKERL